VSNGIIQGGASRVNYQLSKVFQCAGAGDFVQQVHYYQHGVAMPHLPMELKNAAVRPGGGGVKTPIYKPARFTDLYNDNMLFWDTPLLSGVDARTALPFFRPNGGEAGTANNVLPLTHIDGQQLRNPQITEFRFRDPDRDLFANTPEQEFRRMNQTIFFPTDEIAQANTGTGSTPKLMTFNTDVAGTSGVSQLIGNVRFRHIRNTVCNVAFADGSVQSMYLNKSRRYPATGGDESYETTIQRKMLLIRWPTGISPSGVVGSK
jgi:prepilin-type processing-associated H-X9-DG protein